MYGYSQIQRTSSKKDGELGDKSVPYFQQESGPCPLDWRITINSNVDLVFDRPGVAGAVLQTALLLID